MNKPVLTFNEETHQYMIDGVAVKSATTLASAFANLNTDYFKAHPEYAERGTDVHIQLGKVITGEMKESELIADAAKKIAAQFDFDRPWLSECMLFNKEREYAGTADCVMLNEANDGLKMIVDFKSGKTINKKYVQCQLSLYLLAAESMGYKTNDCKLVVINPTKREVLKPLTWDEMIAMIKKELTPTEEIQQLEKQLMELAPVVDQYTEIKEKLAEKLYALFEEQKANTYSGTISATYIAPTTRIGVDVERLKTEKPELYETFKKESAVKGSVRISTKQESKDE